MRGEKYKSNRPCPVCGSVVRYEANSDCVTCRLKQGEQRRRANGAVPVAETLRALQSQARKKAAKKGSTTYVPLLPCKKGHSLRYTSSGVCVVCASLYAEKWRSENRERFLEAQKEWREANKDYVATRRQAINEKLRDARAKLRLKEELKREQLRLKALLLARRREANQMKDQPCQP